MTTVADVIERIYRDYLLPPGEQPARFVVDTGGINASATSLPVDLGMLSPEEQDQVGPGLVIEVGSELMLVEDTDGNDPPEALTVRRGMYGTEAAAHTAGDLVYIAPDYPRQRLFEAVADAVDGLWPDLYSVQVEEVWATGLPIELPSSVGSIIDIRAYVRGGWVPVPGWDPLPDFPLSSTGSAVQVGVASGTRLHVKYRQIPQRPDDETDTLADLGVEDSWVKVIAVMATAELVAAEDVDRATIQFITQALESEGFQIGQGADIRNTLLQYADFLSAPLRRRLTVQERPRVVMHRGF